MTKSTNENWLLSNNFASHRLKSWKRLHLFISIWMTFVKWRNLESTFKRSYELTNSSNFRFIIKCFKFEMNLTLISSFMYNVQRRRSIWMTFLEIWKSARILDENWQKIVSFTNNFDNSIVKSINVKMTIKINVKKINNVTCRISIIIIVIKNNKLMNVFQRIMFFDLNFNRYTCQFNFKISFRQINDIKKMFIKINNNQSFNFQTFRRNNRFYLFYLTKKWLQLNYSINKIKNQKINQMRQISNVNFYCNIIWIDNKYFFDVLC